MVKVVLPSAISPNRVRSRLIHTEKHHGATVLYNSSYDAALPLTKCSAQNEAINAGAKSRVRSSKAARFIRSFIQFAQWRPASFDLTDHTQPRARRESVLLCDTRSPCVAAHTLINFDRIARFSQRIN